MTIDEAIEVLNDISTYVKHGDFPEQYKAIQLGIEALRYIKAGRRKVNLPETDLLPGETGP